MSTCTTQVNFALTTLLIPTYHRKWWGVQKVELGRKQTRGRLMCAHTTAATVGIQRNYQLQN